MRIDDLEMSISFSPKTLSRSRDFADRVFSRMEVVVTDIATDVEKEVGCLECFLLDVVSADRYDDDIQVACDEEDAEVSTFACFSLTMTGLVRGKLLAYLDGTPASQADDDDIDVANVLCVNGGWFTLAPEVLSHVIARLRETIRFDYVIVDAPYVSQERVEDWRTNKIRSDLRMPPPFVDVVWGILAPEDGPFDPKRTFSVARVGDLRLLSDRYRCRRARKKSA